MSTVLNDRDVLLQGGTRNVDPSAGKALLLVPDTNAFHVTAAGAGSPASVTLRAQPLNIPGVATWSITAGGVLTGTGNTRSLAFSGMSVNQVTVTAQIVYDGVTYVATQLISKVVDGAAGTNGSAGLANALAYAYQRSASAITSNPGAVTYTFASASITTPSTNALANGWTKAIPAGSDPLYITMAPASAIGTTDAIAAGEWSTPVQLAVDGADGAPAVNSALVYIYQRKTTASAPALPSASTTYTFGTSGLSGLNNGWTTTIPAASGGAYLYASTAAAVSAGATDSIAAGEWAAAQLLAQDGAPANVNAVAYLCQFAVSAPAAPTGTSTWTWATGVNSAYSVSDGWSLAVPANPGTPGLQLFTAAKPLVAASGTTTSTVSYSGATIAAVAQNGATGPQGVPGVKSATARAYQWATSAPTASGSATWTWATASYNTAPVTGWSMVKPAAPGQGYTLYEATVQLVDGTGATTSAIDWATAARAGISYIGINGTNAISAVLSNDAHTVPTAADGSSGVFTGCASTMTIYNGATDDSAAWAVAATPLAGVTGSLSGKTYTATAMSVDVGYVDLVASRSGYASITSRFTIAKSKGGVAGANATAYWVTTSAGAIKTSVAGVLTPASVTFSAFSATGAGAPAPYSGLFLIAYSADGITFGDYEASASVETTHTATLPPIINVGVAARVRLYKPGAGGWTGATLLDEQVMPVVSDGSTGATGAGARIAYTLADAFTLNLAPATLSMSGTTKPTTGTWGETRAWVDQPTTAPTAGQAWFQSNGIYDGVNTVWGVPYLTNLKAGSLSALSANLGTITSGDIAGTTIHGGAFTSAYAWPANGAGGGFHLSASGLLLGNQNTPGAGYIQINSSGNVYTNQFSIVNGAATFSGSLSAATGTFAGSLSAASGTFVGQVSAGSFRTGAYTGYAWPAAGTGGGVYLDGNGLLCGSGNDGKYFQLTAAGNIYAPQFSIVNGVATFAGALSAASGTFSGNLSGAGGTFAGALSAASGTFSGDLSSARVSVGTAGSATAFFEPGYSGVSLNSSATGVFTADSPGSLAAVFTSDEALFKHNAAAWPIARRIRSGSVFFSIICTAVVDDQLSIWYRVNGGAWVWMSGVQERQGGDGTAATGYGLTLTVGAGATVQFGASGTNASLAAADMGKLYLKQCQMTVIGRNF